MTIQIETKHSIGDTVFFLKENKIVSASIYKVEVTIDQSEKRVILYVRDEKNDISVVSEERTFESKEQLIESL